MTFSLSESWWPRPENNMDFSNDDCFSLIRLPQGHSKEKDLCVLNRNGQCQLSQFRAISRNLKPFFLISIIIAREHASMEPAR